MPGIKSFDDMVNIDRDDAQRWLIAVEYKLYIQWSYMSLCSAFCQD